MYYFDFGEVKLKTAKQLLLDQKTASTLQRRKKNERKNKNISRTMIFERVQGK